VRTDHVMDLLGDRSLYDWKIPDWFPLDLKFDAYALDKYTIFHDCGKPNCRIVDKDGKHHFPNHAQISSFVWMSLFEDEMEIADLIARDMEIHTMTAEDVPKFCKDIDKAKMLATVGLAELHSNAGMFGGIESTSFKIKYKQWLRRAKRILCPYLDVSLASSFTRTAYILAFKKVHDAEMNTIRMCIAGKRYLGS